MINNIRIKNQPLFKEFTFPEQEMKPFVLKISVPWVYLRSVNGIPVTEKKNARHGYCVDYMIDKRHLNFRKDLFAKVRELVSGGEH